MASQMVDARVLRTTIEISATAANGETAVFTASGKAIEFAGFRRAYVEGSDDPAAELEEQETRPADADRRRARSTRDRTRVRARRRSSRSGHETTPPARYTEASLIKELERLGIGRPSTYAPTIGTIERRGYVFRQGKALVPSFTAFAVTRLLREHFGDFVDVEFTAEMEEDLDQISRGEREWLDFIRSSTAATSTIAASRTRSSRREETRRLSADRRRRRSRVGRADPRPHRPLRSVPAARRGRARQDRVAAADAARRRI